MDIVKITFYSLLYFTLLLVVLSIVLYVWSKITLGYLILSALVKLKYKQLKKWTLNLFGKQSETQSSFETIDWSDLETLSDSTLKKEPVPPTSTLPNCAPQKQSKGTSTKKQARDSKGRFTKA